MIKFQYLDVEEDTEGYILRKEEVRNLRPPFFIIGPNVSIGYEYFPPELHIFMKPVRNDVLRINGLYVAGNLESLTELRRVQHVRKYGDIYLCRLMGWDV